MSEEEEICGSDKTAQGFGTHHWNHPQHLPYTGSLEAYSNLVGDVLLLYHYKDKETEVQEGEGGGQAICMSHMW